MLLQIPLEFCPLCNNSLAIISGTPQFFIRHVNNAGGRWNCLWTLTLRLTGRQGRCEPQAFWLVLISYHLQNSKDGTMISNRSYAGDPWPDCSLSPVLAGWWWLVTWEKAILARVKHFPDISQTKLINYWAGRPSYNIVHQYLVKAVNGLFSVGQQIGDNQTWKRSLDAITMASFR